MHLVGYWLQGHESLSSTRPLASFGDLEDWKFRSPPGLETELRNSRMRVHPAIGVSQHAELSQ